MYRNVKLIYCFCLLLCPLLTRAERICKLGDLKKTVEFSSLLEFQTSPSSFNPDHPTYRGNVVTFNFKSIDRLLKNSFNSFDSNSIVKISLNGKGIKTINDDAFLNLFCLHYLELRNNSISKITVGVFNGLNNLRQLDLSENALKHVSEHDLPFFNLQKLEVLNLSKNQISTIRFFDFMNLTNLEILILSSNKIRVVALDTFMYLHSLRELYLNDNVLADSEPEKWLYLNNLEVLDLAVNYLEKIDFSYSLSFYNLKTLNISQNNLRTLNVFALKKRLPRLSAIDITENDWNCYELENIKHHLVDSKITLFGNVNCSISKKYQNVPKIEPEFTSYEITTRVYDTNISEHNKSEEIKESKRISEANAVLFSNTQLLKTVNHLQTMLKYLFIILTLYILIDICVRFKICNKIYNRIVGNRVEHGTFDDGGYLL